MRDPFASLGRAAGAVRPLADGDRIEGPWVRGDGTRRSGLFGLGAGRVALGLDASVALQAPEQNRGGALGDLEALSDVGGLDAAGLAGIRDDLILRRFHPYLRRAPTSRPLLSRAARARTSGGGPARNRLWPSMKHPASSFARRARTRAAGDDGPVRDPDVAAAPTAAGPAPGVARSPWPVRCRPHRSRPPAARARWGRPGRGGRRVAWRARFQVCRGPI